MIELIVFVIGFALGWYINSWASAIAFKQILKDLGISDDQIVKLADQEGLVEQQTANTDSVTLNIKVERHGDRLYAYREEDDEFLAYGDTAELLLSETLKRYPKSTNLVIVQGRELVDSYVQTLGDGSR